MRHSISLLVLFLALSLCVLMVLSFNLSYLPPNPIMRPPGVEAAVCRPWTCHGNTNRQLVDKLYAGSVIKTTSVRDALLLVDRASYVPAEQQPGAYDDAPRSIGYGQTISAPHMHAKALEELLPAIQRATSDGPVKILDVGSGSGYLSAAFGRLLSVLGTKGGKVFGIDCVPELVTLARENIEKSDGDLLTSGVVSIQVGDGWKGLADEGPFHAIHVGAGADSLPKELASQLAVGGRMVCPIETSHGYQSFYVIDRIKASTGLGFEKNDFQIRELFPVSYVPLVHV